MNDFISKPFEPRQLWQKLARWLPAPDAVRHEVPANQAASAGRPPARDGPSATIAGLDTTLGMRHLAGKAELYRKTLQQFVKGNGQTRQDLIAAIDAGDIAAAGRIVHNLKSAAGTIGATALQAEVAALENLLADKGNEGEIRTSTEAALSSLDALLAGLRHELASPRWPAP
jgi:two-component system sensor histidine kinase/response regulator